MSLDKSFEWKGQTSTTKNLIDTQKQTLPAIVKIASVPTDYSGSCPELASNKMFFVYKVESKQRVMIKSNENRHFTIPLETTIMFQHIFCHDRGPGMLLKDMLKSRRNTSELNVGMVNNADAFMCQTPDLANSVKYGQLFVVGIYEEQCLVGRSMTSATEISAETTQFPVNAPISFDVATGLQKKPADEFHKLKAKLVQAGDNTPAKSTFNDIALLSRSPRTPSELASIQHKCRIYPTTLTLSTMSDTSSTTGAPSINKILGQLAQKSKQPDIPLFQRKTVYENATKPAVVDKNNNNNKKPDVKAPEPEDKLDYDYVIVQEGPAASQNHKQQQQEQDDIYENEDNSPQVYYLDNDRGTKPSSTLTRGGLPPVPKDVSNQEQNLKTPTATTKMTTPASSVKTTGNVGGWKAMTLPHPNKASNPADIYENQDETTNNSSSNKPFGSGGVLKAATLTRNKDSNPTDIYLNEEDEKKPRSSSSGVTKATPPWEKNKINEIPKTEKIPIEKCEKKKEPEIPSDDELYDQLNYVDMDIKKNQKMAPAKSSSSSMNDVKAAAGKFFRRGGSGDKDEEKEKEKKKEKEKTASSTVTLPPLPDRRPSTAVEVGKRNNSEDEEEYEYPDPVEFGVSQRKESQNLGSPTSVNSSSSIGSSDEKKSSAASVAAAKIGNWGANQLKKIKEIGRDSKDVSSEAGKQNRWHDVSEIPKDIDVESFTVGEVVECLHHLNLGKYAKAFTKSQVDGTFLMNLNELMLARSFKMNTLDARKLIMFAKEKWRPSM